jgi:hypothetical protein
METMTRTLDPEMDQPAPTLSTVRPNSWFDHLSDWFTSLAEEMERADSDYNPLIDYPRDL